MDVTPCQDGNCYVGADIDNRFKPAGQKATACGAIARFDPGFSLRKGQAIQNEIVSF